jgi:Uma2 family endonuclease
VLSPSNSATDLVLKRHEYAAVGIPMYWIVDPVGRTVTVLELRDGPGYDESAVLKPGDRWSTERPFPLTVTPADYFDP